MALGAFQTPDNERSFSSLVDQVIIETGQTAALRAVVQAANLTIRECQAVGLFAPDLLEEQVVTIAQPHIYFVLPNLRRLRTAYYVTAAVYPKLILPGRKMKLDSMQEDYYFYRAQNYYAFMGAAVGETINIANYYWAQRLVYYARVGAPSNSYPGAPYSLRPAYWDDVQQAWLYLQANNVDYALTTTDLDGGIARQNAAMNWILFEWFDMISDGTKAKIFNLKGDARATASYAQYKANQETLRRSKSFEAEDV